MQGFVIPAYQAASSIGPLVRELRRLLAARAFSGPILVVDDGSTDGTADRAREAGATVLCHARNRGKGAGLQTSLEWAQAQGLSALVSLDADGQHPPGEAVRLLDIPGETECLVLGIRDLAAAGAPLANQRSNRFSNQVLSLFGGTRLADTQCGLRRYPVTATRALGAGAQGFAFEAEVVLRAARRGLPIVQVPIEVIYPPEEERVTHFDKVRDPTRIVLSVVKTTLIVPHHKLSRRLLRWALAALIAYWLWRSTR